MAEYQYTTGLKYPITCLHCSKEKDLNTTLMGPPASLTTPYLFLDYRSQVAPTQINVYMGDNFFKGSSICMDLNSTNQYDMIQFFKDQLNAENTGSNAMMKALAGKMATSVNSALSITA